MGFRFIDRWQGRLRDLFPPGATTDELVAALELRDRSLEAHLEAPGWIAPTLLNSWVNFNAATHQVAQYRKVGDMVQVRGLVKSGTATAGTAILTLPVGFRPPSLVNFAGEALWAAAGFNVRSDGDLTIDFGSNVWFSINCQFSVTA